MMKNKSTLAKLLAEEDIFVVHKKMDTAYFDPKSRRDDPRWFAVDIQLNSVFKTPVTLPRIKEMPGLEEMVLLSRGRLSVQPVTASEWKIIVAAGS